MIVNGVEHPPGDPMEALRREATTCRACPLWEHATQTVFGEGPTDAEVMLVGEQPGDQEDLQGRPFVGPAGQLLDRAIADARLDRAGLYVTNAVKHFKFIMRGKRRLHQKPRVAEITACRPWLMHEMELLRPRLVIALGATAARAVFGREMKVGRDRGHLFDLDGGEVRASITTHPSALLRMPDPALREREYARLVGDLRSAAAVLDGDS